MYIFLVAGILLSLKILLADLPQTKEITEIRNWIDCEYKGYGDNVIPSYRILNGIPFGTYSTVSHQITGPIPLEKTNLKIMNEITGIDTNFNLVPYGESIIAVQERINQCNKKNIDTQDKPIPTEISSYLSNDNLHIVAMHTKIPITEFLAIKTNIIYKLVDLVLELENTFGNLDDLDILNCDLVDPSKINVLTQNIYTTIFNDNTVYDKSIELGDNNILKKSNLGGIFDRLGGKK